MSAGDAPAAPLGGRPAAPPERAGHGRHERGDLRAVETTVLLLVALLLAIATVNDVVRQTHVNQRLIADLATWRAYTHLPYHNLSVKQSYTEHFTREVVCGNTSPGEPKQRIQLCLVMSGPVVGGRRHVSGGWYLPARAVDRPGARYACFGSAPEEFTCRR